MLDYADLKPEDYPVVEAQGLDPDIVYFLHSSNSLTHHIRVTDISSELPRMQSGSADEDRFITDKFLHAAQDVHQSRKCTEMYRVSKKAFYSTSFDLRASSATADSLPLVSITRSLRSLGKQAFHFPEGSLHSTHEISISAVGIGRRSYMFVKDSVPYFWDMDNGKRGCLHKVVDGKRRRVGELGLRHSYERDCVLVLDSSALDMIVAVASCVAVMNRLDSF